MGVCIDTAHIFAAGYDITTDYDGVMRQGAIGEGAFRRIMNDPHLSGVAKVIETPKIEEDVTDRMMLERLRGYIE